MDTGAATAPRILWYFADPMCSWCWGFTPVISAIKESYADQFKIALIMGGLRPWTTEPMLPVQREEILHHWRAVHQRTSQPFLFDDAMPSGFVYDTEPASRAVIAVAEINPQETFPYFKSVQAAFYTQGLNVTQPATLATLAELHQISTALFLELFHSEAVALRTREHFRQAQQAGVRGFPTLVMQDSSGLSLLTHGYRPFSELQPDLAAWLVRPA